MRRRIIPFALLGLIGISNLGHFSEKLFASSENVRAVHVIGLSGGGFACGVVPGRRMANEDKTSVEKQPPLSESAGWA
jgi:hypothetical protein